MNKGPKFIFFTPQVIFNESLCFDNRVMHNNMPITIVIGENQGISSIFFVWITAKITKEPCSAHIVELPFGLQEYSATLVQGW